MDRLTLVLLPGLDGTGDLFANFLQELPPFVKAIPLGYPKQRFLTYPDLVSWLGGIVPKEGPFAIVAESYGTPLAVKFAATHPPNLVGLILSAGFISNPVRIWGPIPKLLSRPFFFQFRPPAFLHKYFSIGTGAPESLRLAVRNAVGSVSPDVLAKRARATIDVDATQEIRQVKVPLLYLQADEDNLVGKGCLEEIKRLHPETISISIHAPHLLLQREPRVTARAILQFLNTNCRLDESGVERFSMEQN